MMLERLKYINHENEVIDFGMDGIYVKVNELHNYSWSYSTSRNKISSFVKGIENKSIPIIIYCEDEEEGISKKNKLFEVMEKDVLSVEHGKIIIGDYYLKCYVTGSKKSNYLIHKGYLETSLTITTDYPKWINESKTSFFPNGSAASEANAGSNLDYPHDYPYDYAGENGNKKLINTGFADSNFQMIIYGTCTNPAITISGHKYQVYAEVSDNEYITIDSLTKKITLTKYNGEKVNLFNSRNRDSYIFKLIASGDHVISWSGSFGFDIILFEERSEPKWI